MKIRKNAHKKIGSLLAKATVIKVEEKEFDYYQDLYTWGDEREITEQIAVASYNKNYSSIYSIWLKTDENGEPVELNIYANNMTITATFAPVVEEIEVEQVEEIAKIQKVKMSYSQVKSMINEGFVAPLSSIAKKEEKVEDQEKKIEKVTVIWSESPLIPEGSYTLEQYNWLASKEVYQMRKDGDIGYSKTKVNIVLANGDDYEFRHDVSPREPRLSDCWSSWVDYCRKQAS